MRYDVGDAAASAPAGITASKHPRAFQDRMLEEGELMVQLSPCRGRAVWRQSLLADLRHLENGMVPHTPCPGPAWNGRKQPGIPESPSRGMRIRESDSR